MPDPAPEPIVPAEPVEPVEPVIPVEPQPEPEPEPTPPSDNDFSLPDDQKEKPWADKIKSQDDLYKQLDNLNGLVGRKTLPPIDYEIASPEEIEAHHKELAPADAQDYNFGEDADPELVEAFSPVFQKLGFTAYQVEQFAPMVNEIAENMVEAKEELKRDDGEYFKMLEASFGSDHANIAQTIDTQIGKYASAKDKEFFDSISDNETRVALDRTIHNILRAHGANESGANTNQGGNDGGAPKTDVESVRKDLRKQIHELDGTPYSDDKMMKLKNQLSDTYKT